MDTDDESLYDKSSSPTTNADVTTTRFYFGFGTPPALELLAPTFNFGMEIPPPAPPSGASSPTTFNFGMHLDPFNLGFSLPTTATQNQTETPASSVQQPFNLGFDLLHLPRQSTSETTPQRPFNLGFNLPIPATAATPAISPTTPVSTHANTAPPATSKPQHVGYDINNQSFQFGCEPPSPVGQWTPALIQAVAPIAADISTPTPPVHMPAEPVTTPVEYKVMALPKIERAPQPPTVASLVTDANEAAMDIVRCLGGEEYEPAFDELAQKMVGGALGPGDDVWDPTSEEVLESNRVMLLAFCENRDRLTRIFKDLISLYHVAHVHECIVPSVYSLLEEVECAEAKCVNPKYEVDQ
ncbi:hypothetical protein F4604DRAFT_1674437 [Suillus subluteus]|nr:hypothetical protein F4604DRAFT_1674437 [Suillus subluteus]